MALRALDLTGEVIVPAFTFVATPHAVSWERLTPVFADVDGSTHNLCCSRGATMIGSLGDCEVFSFHATKFFNTFEGGAITTNDDELAARLRSIRNFGFVGVNDIEEVGTNAKMSEVCAAMGLSMFGCLDELLEINRSHFQLYASQLEHLPGVSVQWPDRNGRANWQYVVLDIGQRAFGCSRDSLMERLHQNNVRARRYFFPGCHKLAAYQAELSLGGRQLPQTDELCVCRPAARWRALT